MKNAVDCYIKQEVRRQLSKRRGLGDSFPMVTSVYELPEKKSFFDFDNMTTMQKLVVGTHAVMSAAGGALNTYHGYKRNRGSIPWALLWGALGTGAPIITTAVALAQGFGKPIKKG